MGEMKIMIRTTIQPKEFIMTETKRQSTMMVVGAMLIAAPLLFTGCSQSPVEPNLEPNQEPSQPQVLGRGGIFASGPQGSPIAMYTEQVVSAQSGGRIELFDVALDIPAGALDVDATYSISIPDISVFYNEFGTHGLVFNVPVTVTMSYRGADLSGVDESSIRLGWWDEVNGRWVDMDCQLDRVNQVVTGKLYHFSAYALVSD
jgi:hypothetical protein